MHLPRPDPAQHGSSPAAAWLCALLFASCGGTGSVGGGDGRGGDARSLGETFAASEAPVKLTDYWPTRALSRLYRVPGGRIYYKQVIEPVDAKAWEPTRSALTARPGEERYLLHDYFDHDGANVDARFWGDTWHLRNVPSTGEVSEVADTFPLRTADGTADRRDCLAPCSGRIAVYQGQAIGHGAPGGHRVGVTFANLDIRWSYSASQAPPYDELPATYGSWSEVTLLEKLDTYTPEYGADATGAFGPGRAATYKNVVRLRFGHGNRLAGQPEPTCGNQPPEFPHRPGMLSFWQDLWLAPDVGIIKFENLFHEPSCDGSVLHPAEGANGGWLAYLDRLVELAPRCDAPRDEVVTNTCQEVGYPRGFAGAYVSRRAWSCASGTWSDWTREDTCGAPVCAQAPDQVVTNSCQEVGYPPRWVGAYVSTRRFDCATGGYGDWERNDTCRAP